MKKQFPLLNKITLLLALLLSSAVSNAQNLDAILDWSNRTELSSAVSGIINKVNVVTGQRVKKGEILTQLSQTLFDAQVARTQAALASEKEALNEAKRELNRSLELYERTVLAEHELQMAKNAHKKAQANFKKAQADFTQAKILRGFSTLKAPFDAVVLKVLRKKDENVNARIETPLMVVIAESGKMIAKAGIPASMLDEVQAGRIANVIVDDKTYEGKINSVGLEFIKGTNQYPVEVEFETGTIQLRAGMKANIEF